MYAQDKNEVKVKVAVRQQTVQSDATLYGAVLFLVILPVVVLLGRSLGGM